MEKNRFRKFGTKIFVFVNLEKKIENGKILNEFSKFGDEIQK